LPVIETKEVRTPGAAAHRFDAWSSTFWQFLRFCLVGGVNTLIDLLTLNILLWRFPTHNVQVLVVYNSVAYTSGAVSSFFLNKYWTFRRRQRLTRREVVRFALSLCFEILYSSGLVWLAGKALQPVITNPTLWGNASKLLAVACGTVISYACMRFWTFASVSRDRPEKQETFHRTATEPRNRAASNVTEHGDDHAESERA
jgi:putative flippase GtrA